MQPAPIYGPNVFCY